MPTGKEIALGVALGSATSALVAWKAFFPYLSDDIKTLKMSNKVAKVMLKKLMSGKFLVDDFEDHVATDPKKTFIIYEDKCYTYEMVDAMANKVASIALTWNLQPTDIVATMIYNEPAFIWTFLGLQKIGLADAFINYHLTSKPLLHSIHVSEAKVLIIGAGDELLHSILDIQDGLPDIPIYVQGKTQSNLPPGVKSFDDIIVNTLPTPICRSARSHMTLVSPMCYIYTSGTTGLPKPAIITQVKGITGAVVYSLFDFTRDDVLYVVTPLYHSAATMICLFNLFTFGATMVLRKKFSATHYFEDCRKHNVTVIQYIGELFRYILAQPKTSNDPVHKIRVAFGNGLRQDIWKEFQDRFRIPWIIEFFGATEGTGALLNVNNKVGACGRLSPILQRFSAGLLSDIHILKYDPIEDQPIRDKHGHCVKVKPGEQGILISPIPETYKGFYKGDEKMNEKKIIRNVFKDGDAYFNFGDLLYLDKDYYIYFRDRVGDTFRWKGENVSTREVCDVISTLDFVHDVNVYGVQIPGNEGRAGMAAIVLKDNAKVTPDMLRTLYTTCQMDLPSYARPILLRFQKDLIVTQTMKHRKIELVQDGYDMTKITDPLFYIDNDNKTYSALSPGFVHTFVHSKL